MYYHVIIETTEKISNLSNQEYFAYNHDNLIVIKEKILIPYLKKKEFVFQGVILREQKIRQIQILETDKSIEDTVLNANKNIQESTYCYTKKDVLKDDDYAKNITELAFSDISVSQEAVMINNQKTECEKNKKVFIVHGHDNLAKTEVARFLEKLNLEPIILHEQPSSSSTIIEKIEKNSDVGYAIVLYTGCDIGASIKNEDKLQKRARQNVVFEHGYFIAKLKRENVCALIKDKVEKPNDISGVVYLNMDDKNGWQVELAKELKHAGYPIDLNILLS